MNNDWQVPKYNINEIKSKTKKYCVCTPIINEGERIKKELIQMYNKKIYEKIDIIICDGGSTDGSTNIDFLKQMNVCTLLIKTGPGKLSAQLRMGYSYALKKGYEGIITIDGNNKDNIDAIPYFLDELEKGFDFIQGSRFISGGREINTPLLRKIAIKFIHAPMVSLISQFKYTDTTNGYRGYSRRFLMDPKIQPFRDIFQNYELLAYLSVKAGQLGYNIKEIPIIRAYPSKGEIPTKISKLKGNFEIFLTLWYLIIGKYDIK